MATGDQEYKTISPLLKQADRDLGRRIGEALSSLGDPYLVRAHVQSHRIKTAESIRRKAKQKRRSFAEALQQVNDLVGYRIVCHNIQDAERAAHLLENSLKEKGIEVTRESYVRKAKRSGYRAIHLDIELPVQKRGQVNCEVQIRSLLQDAWAHLSRADMYTAERSISPVLRRTMRRLADLLSVADDLAEDIRREISKPRHGKRSVKAAPLSTSSISFLYRRAFDTDPPGYLVEQILRDFKDTPLRTDGLEAALRDKNLLKRFRSAYGKHARWKPGPAQLFRWVVQAAARGTDSAKRSAEKEGKQEWAEVDAIYRRETLSGLPETWDELLNLIEFPAKDGDLGYDLREWAEALGALGSCSICGERIVHEDSLAEGFARHYRLRGKKADDAREAFGRAIGNSGVETGDGSLCSYHSYQMSKDD